MTITWEEFRDFGRDYDFDERLQMFDDNPEIPKKIIDEKVEDFYMELARWEKTPKELLEEFAKGKDVYIRRQLAQNPNAPYEFIKRVFNNSKDDSMVYSTARNPQLKETDIRKFIDSYTYSSYPRLKLNNILQNPNCPHDILKQFYDQNRLTYGEFISKNPNQSPDLIEMCLTIDSQYRNDFLRYTNFTDVTLKLVSKTMQAKNDLTKYMLIALSKNVNLQTNDKFREFFVASIIYRSTNLSKVEIIELFDNSVKYLSHSDFNNLYDIFDKAHLVLPFLKSKNVPIKIATEILANGMTAQFAYKINRNLIFRQEDFLKIMINDVKNLQAKMDFFNRYENEMVADTISRLYEHFNDDRFLPKTVRDIFLF